MGMYCEMVDAMIRNGVYLTVDLDVLVTRNISHSCDMDDLTERIARDIVEMYIQLDRQIENMVGMRSFPESRTPVAIEIFLEA